MAAPKRPPVSATNGRGFKTSWPLELSREQMIGLMVMESRAACCLPEPTTDDLMAMRAAWARVLQDIPTQFLERCFDLASRQHQERFPMTSYQIATAWSEVCASGQAEEWFKEHARALPRPDCDLCQNTGREPIEVEGQGWTSRKCSCGR